MFGTYFGADPNSFYSDILLFDNCRPSRSTSIVPVIDLWGMITKHELKLIEILPYKSPV